MESIGGAQSRRHQRLIDAFLSTNEHLRAAVAPDATYGDADADEDYCACYRDSCDEPGGDVRSTYRMDLKGS